MNKTSYLDIYFYQGESSFVIFWYVLVCDAYITWSKQFKLWEVPFVVGSIVIVGALTCCALLHSLCDLKDMQMNVQYSIIWEIMLYEFKLCHKAAEATKNISYAKGQGAIDYRNQKFGSRNFTQVARIFMMMEP